MPNASRIRNDISISIDRYLSWLESERDAAGDNEIPFEIGTCSRHPSVRDVANTRYRSAVPSAGKSNVGESDETIGGTKGMKGTSLVRPSDITDAIDAQDFLDQFLSKNLDVIGDKREERIRSDWVDQQSRLIREQYNNRARAAYEQMWKECSKTKLGHSFIRIDVKGFSLDQCSVCSYIQGKAIKKKQDYYGVNQLTDDTPIRLAKDMNNDLITIMANRMIELDEKAAILVWPKPEDMPSKELKHRLAGKEGSKNLMQPILQRD